MKMKGEGMTHKDICQSVFDGIFGEPSSVKKEATKELKKEEEGQGQSCNVKYDEVGGIFGPVGFT